MMAKPIIERRQDPGGREEACTLHRRNSAIKASASRGNDGPAR